MDTQTETYDYINPAHYKKEDGTDYIDHLIATDGPEKAAYWCDRTAGKYLDRIGKKPGEGAEREMQKVVEYRRRACEFRHLIPTAREKAEAAYHRYCEVVDFKNHQGNPVPAFENLPEQIKKAWEAAAAV